MVRPQSGSPRSKHRPFSDNYNSMNHEGRYGPPSRSQRGFRGPPGKAPPSWRVHNSSGSQPYPKRPSSLMGERRERPHGQWMQNQDHFHPYPNSQDSQRGRRRPSPPRSSRPPPVQHRQSPHTSIHGPPSHRAPVFHGNHPRHTSPSRHGSFHGPPSDRRIPSPHNSFRGPQRRPSPQDHDRSWGPTPRERPFGRPALGGHHWNGPGGYPHPHSGDSRFPGPPHRKPREFHGRSSYPESSSPIDRRLSRDLVVVSHWEAGHKPSTSPRNSAPWRNKASRSKSEESESRGNLTLNERFTKLQSPPSSSQEQKERRSSGSPPKTRKPVAFQRPGFRPAVGVKRPSAPDGVIRKPLMSTLIPRPTFNQKSVFKKSQSIMSKYKNLQTLRHKVPHQRQATSYRRW
ncbi:uncharacterized protein isoform X1 [Danio rerio]|uniref:Uncharacterized protein isoform X1 n=1 Tax=Danio rerio TaxID=7955 RepID=A0AC58JHQ3_DANRE